MSEKMEESELCFPHLSNASCRKSMLPHFEVMLIYSMLSSISVVTVILNLLVIISISHFRQLQTPTNLLLLSLAISDFIVGILMFFQINLLNGCWFLGDIMCIIYQYLAYTITAASTGTMVIISLDRYVAVCYPLHYTTKVTQHRAKMCVCLCWICSMMFQCVILKEDLKHPGRFHSCVGECLIVIDYIVGYVDMTASFIIPVTVIVTVYFRVFVVAVTHVRAMRSHITAFSLRGSATIKKSELKAARTLGIVVLVYLLCMCPYFCVAITGSNHLLNASSAMFVIFLIYFNSCLNPIIYTFVYSWFRKSIKLIVTLQILQQYSCDINIM